MTILETAIVAAQPQALADFYREVFCLEHEWTVDLDDDSFAGAGLGVPCRVICLGTSTGQRLKFLGPAQPPRAREKRGTVVAAAGTPLFTLVVDDLDATLRAADLAGGGPLGDGRVINARPGVRICFIADPEGNAIEMIERAN